MATLAIVAGANMIVFAMWWSRNPVGAPGAPLGHSSVSIRLWEATARLSPIICVSAIAATIRAIMQWRRMGLPR